MDARRAPVPVYYLLSGGSAFCYALSFTLTMVYQVQQIGLSPLQLVLVGTVLEASVFLGEVPTGIVADVYSRKLSLLIGFVLIGCGLAISAVPSFLVVLAGQVLWGVGYTFTSGAQQAWISDEIGPDRAAPVFVRATQVALGGTITGTLLAGALGLVWIGTPIIAGGVGFLVLAGVLAIVMPERGFTRSAERTTWATVAGQFRAGLALARRRRVVRVLMLVSLISGLSSEAFDRLWTVHLLDSGLPSFLGEVLWFAAIGLGGTVVSLVVSLVVNRLFKNALMTLHPTRLLALLTVLEVVAVGAFALSGQFWVLLVLLWMRSSVHVVAEPVVAGWMNRNLESGVRATVLSFDGQMNAIGQVAGGPVLGAVGNAVSVRAALIASSLTLVPAVAVYAAARDRSDRFQPSPLE